jgi:putative phosphoserine phosphatase/1-acylglycerol-3-phosphate O-acyltransferase
MQLYDKVIKEVEQSDEGSHIGAFFDFDGTIIYGYSATTYLREQLKRGDVKPSQLPELVRTMTKFSMGSMGFSAMMTETSGYLKGIEEKHYIEFGEHLYKKHIAKLVYPESRALIEAHLKKGHTVALISAATPYQVVPAAAELGIEHVKCTHLEVVDGKFTGEVVSPTCYGMGKVHAAQQICEQYGAELDKSFFYSDSDEDIQLLEHVGNPRPLNPNSRLRRTALGRGWPVQDFSSRGSSGVRDYVRTLATQGSMVSSFLAGVPMYALTGSMQKARNFSISLFADTASAIVGIELSVTGEEHIWNQRPCVFVFNHQSQADTIILPSLLRRDIAGVGKKEIANVPILGKLMQIGGTVLIDRENTASAVEAMAPLVEVIQKKGCSVCLAPEGTRSTSTNLGRFKKGAFHLAMQAGVPIVPIVIHNAIDVAPRGQFVMRPATVKVTVLPGVDTTNWTPATINEHVDDVRDLFLEELGQMELQRPAELAKPISKTVSDKQPSRVIAGGVQLTAKKISKKLATKKTAAKKVAKKRVKAKTTAALDIAVGKQKERAHKAVSTGRKKAKKVLGRRRANKQSTIKVSAKQANEAESSLEKAVPIKAKIAKQVAKKTAKKVTSRLAKKTKRATKKDTRTSADKGKK